MVFLLKRNLCMIVQYFIYLSAIAEIKFKIFFQPSNQKKSEKVKKIFFLFYKKKKIRAFVNFPDILIQGKYW